MAADQAEQGRFTVEELPRLYRDLTDWWPVLSAPEDYAEEAEFYRSAIVSASRSMPVTLLELGSGGGNNASHLKKHFQMTLVELSPGMLQVSRELNPECEHVQGDMRTVRLGRQFDAVFIHDAICYMTSEQDLSGALRTAFEHCKPGGVALFAPDHTKENLKPSTDHGGHDRGNRSMRYLEWTWDPDPSDTTYLQLMVYVLREGSDEVQCIQDRHVCGLFSHDRWLALMSEVGFDGRSIPFEHSEVDPGSCEVFLGLKPPEST
jgi:SAM-dependent methyltransferase